MAARLPQGLQHERVEGAVVHALGLEPSSVFLGLPRPSSAFYEPSTDLPRPSIRYTRQGSDGDCYDIIWQLVLTRPKGNSEAAWQAVTFNQMHEGFGGAADSPCTEALSPIGKGLSFHS